MNSSVQSVYTVFNGEHKLLVCPVVSRNVPAEWTGRMLMRCHTSSGERPFAIRLEVLGSNSRNFDTVEKSWWTSTCIFIHENWAPATLADSSDSNFSSE